EGRIKAASAGLAETDRACDAATREARIGAVVHHDRPSLDTARSLDMDKLIATESHAETPTEHLPGDGVIAWHDVFDHGERRPGRQLLAEGLAKQLQVDAVVLAAGKETDLDARDGAARTPGGRGDGRRRRCRSRR